MVQRPPLKDPAEALVELNGGNMLALMKLSSWHPKVWLSVLEVLAATLLPTLFFLRGRRAGLLAEQTRKASEKLLRTHGATLARILQQGEKVRLFTVAQRTSPKSKTLLVITTMNRLCLACFSPLVPSNASYSRCRRPWRTSTSPVVLSLLYPGMGHLLNGRLLRGALYMTVFTFSALFTAIQLVALYTETTEVSWRGLTEAALIALAMWVSSVLDAYYFSK